MTDLARWESDRKRLLEIGAALTELATEYEHTNGEAGRYLQNTAARVHKVESELLPRFWQRRLEAEAIEKSAIPEARPASGEAGEPVCEACE